MKTHIFGHSTTEHLTEHFTLGEMLHSQVAIDCHTLNPVDDPSVIDALALLCQQVLEPLRMAVCHPIVLRCAYCSAFVSWVITRREQSQYHRGEAADIGCPYGKEEARFYYDFIRLHLPFDRLYLCHLRKTDEWYVHVSYSSAHAQRREAGEKELEQ